MAAVIRILSVATIIVAITVSASCSPPQAPSQAVCDGVTSDAGGCTTERHEFVGTTCDDLAREWAEFVDKLAVAIIDGPADVGQQGKSVRLKQAVVITTVDLNERMRHLSLRAECDVDGVIRVADPVFSPGLKARIGGAMYDGDPIVTYNDWLDDVRQSLQVIDDED